MTTFAAAGQVKDVAVGDLDGDGKAEIIVRAASRKGVVAAAYHVDGGKMADLDPESLAPASRTSARAVFGSLPGARPAVAVLKPGSAIRFQPFEASFLGGISAIIAE